MSSLIADPTYSNLKTAIAGWLHRADLTSAIPDFIGIGEQRMNNDCKARDMETTTTLTTSAGTATVATPTDLVETRRITLTTDPYTVLAYWAPEKFAKDFPASWTGTPQAYTSYGGYYQIGPLPDATYTLSLVYAQRIPALSDTNTTNWLLTKWPYAYLYASLVSSAPYLRDDARIATWEAMYQQAMKDINSIDWFSGNTPRVRAA